MTKEVGNSVAPSRAESTGMGAPRCAPGTRGPWIVEDTGANLWIGYPKAWAHKVADVVCHLEVDPTYADEAKARKRADARLIAAAPELYEALEATTRELERVLNLMGLHHDDLGEIALYRGKDALAKAEGRDA